MFFEKHFLDDFFIEIRFTTRVLVIKSASGELVLDILGFDKSCEKNCYFA